MDIKILHSWLLEYLETKASPQKICECLALCGPSCEKVYPYGKNDWLYEIEITTNRVDSMSVYGIAREAAAILPQFGIEAKLKPLNLNKAKVPTKSLPLKIKTDPQLTNRVMAVVMDNIEIKQSPDWIKERLEATGIRSLNSVIDITNYIMTEIGHPTHVFDYDLIKDHSLIFRKSKKGEQAITLDKKAHILPGDDNVIVDSENKIIDIPGIMGTANSVVNDNTKRIIFFIDNNDPKILRKTSMTLGIRTVAATLNEKRVDPELAQTAMLRGIELYEKICKAKMASKIYDIYDHKSEPKTVKTSLQFIEERIGVPIKPNLIKQTLVALGFKVKSTDNKNFEITVPSWRSYDVEIPEDIVEEIARIYGYHNLPSIVPLQEQTKAFPLKQQFYWENLVKHTLKNWGYFETYSYSVISKEMIEKFELKTQDHLKIKNPLSTEWEYMRTSLVPSILTLIHNNQSGEENLKFFEMANIYLPRENELPEEKLTLIISQNDDFLVLKGLIEALCEEIGISDLKFKRSKEKYLDENIQAKIYFKENLLGNLGKVSQKMQDKFEIKNPTYIANLDFAVLASWATKNKKYQPLPKHPPIIEDLTFYNLPQVPAEKILETGKKSSNLINQIRIIDAFENKISLEISYLTTDRNLTTEDVAPIRKKLVEEIENLGMKLQGEI
ncbi:phenylalanine--tRNA ligase subunit beta [Candidatus Beckwithbacteria bacterium]|nr:phenylalanine--tRNA ligase subunit beta [Candidatus Beckwithbacteria bacterium]